MSSVFPEDLDPGWGGNTSTEDPEKCREILSFFQDSIYHNQFDSQKNYEITDLNFAVDVAVEDVIVALEAEGVDQPCHYSF